ncbi:hypothetical protein AUK22_03915 [bacterium CG2_30_54_10]|nr:MAG: hypothetical protein AUK22_03915 [bacterium CG2_30_54_10]
MNSQFFPVCEGETVSSFPEARQPRSLRRSASGFSFLEYLVAFIILVAAFIPIFLSSQTTIQQVAVTGRHLLATQVAQGLLDRYLSLPFNQCVASLTGHPAMGGPVAYLGDPEVQSLLAMPELEGVKDELADNASVSMDFKYQLDCFPKPEEVTYLVDSMKIRISVFFQVKRGPAGASPEVQTTVSGIKFREIF